jgi:hypothetical protein
MTTDESMAPHKPGNDSPLAVSKRVDLGLTVFLALGAVACLLPHVSILFVGVYWAVLVATAVFVLWSAVMPTSCMNGGLICSLVAMAVFFNAIGIALGASIRFVVSLFT